MAHGVATHQWAVMCACTHIHIHMYTSAHSYLHIDLKVWISFMSLWICIANKTQTVCHQHFIKSQYIVANWSAHNLVRCSVCFVNTIFFELRLPCSGLCGVVRKFPTSGAGSGHLKGPRHCLQSLWSSGIKPEGALLPKIFFPFLFWAMNRGGRKGAPKIVPVGQPEEVTQELGEDGVAQAVRDVDMEPEIREPTLADLTGLFQAHMAKMDAQESQRTAEYAQQGRRFKALQHQFSLLQLEVQARTTPIPNPLLTARDTLDCPEDEDVVPSRPLSQSTACQKDISEGRDTGQCQFKEPKLEKLSVSDDVEHFLITFERMAAVCRWPKEDWAFHLIPLLTGKARAAYVHMDVDDSLDYEELKSAILRKYDINREAYRQRFRSLDVELLESPKELYVRLKELYGKWMQPKSKSVEEIGEVIILEQYLRMLSPELQVWVREHDPQSASQAATLADVFVAARKGNQPWCWKPGRDDRRSNLHQQSSRDIPSASKFRGVGPAFVTAAKSHRKVPICYLCGQEGHTKPMCPKMAVKATHLCYVPRGQMSSPVEAERSPPMTTVEVNGRELAALIDTGSDQTLVHPKYISPVLVRFTEKKAVRCVHGDEKLLPTAEVYVKVRGQTYLLEVGIADNLPFPVVLGHDLPVLWDLLQLVPTCNMVVTRAQARKEEKEQLLGNLPFFDVEIGGSVKPRNLGDRKGWKKFNIMLLKCLLRPLTFPQSLSCLLTLLSYNRRMPVLSLTWKEQSGRM